MTDTQMTQKEQKELYGKPMKPIVADRVFVKDMEGFDYDHVHTQCWILINEANNTRIHINSYDGKLGKKYNGNSKQYEWDAEKHPEKYKKKGYEEVSISECPFAISTSEVSDESED